MGLTGLLRRILKRSTGEPITLGEELELIEMYLAIERARFEERLRVKIDVPFELRMLPIPPLLLQPLVENAVRAWHLSHERRRGDCRRGGVGTCLRKPSPETQPFYAFAFWTPAREHLKENWRKDGGQAWG